MTVPQPPTGRPDPNEAILLAMVQQEVQDRSRQSLHGVIWRTLGRGEIGPLPRQGHLHLAEGGSSFPWTDAWTGGEIGQLLDHPSLQGRLMITGPAGIGKTTLLLELAAAAIQRAQQDATQPMPVIFHLSSWAAEEQPFGDWLWMELRVKYGISKPLGGQWLGANRLFPLLDGFDDLAPPRQAAAATALNDWLTQTPGPLVVCCRCAHEAPAALALALKGTLALEPLTPNQIEAYLTARQLEPLWAKVQRWPAQLDLLSIPLWLNLLIVTRVSLDVSTWERLATPQAQQNYLLNRYIDQQLHHPWPAEPTDPNPISPQQMLHWLGWLANHINEQAEHEFLIEMMQPSLLENRRQIICYSLLGGIIFGVMGGLVFGLLIGPGSGLFVTFAITSLFIIRRGDDEIIPIDTQPNTISLMRFIFVRQINYLVIFALLIGFLLALSGQGLLQILISFVVGMAIILFSRSLIALPSWFIGHFVFRINRFLEGDIALRTHPNQGIRDARNYSLRTAAMFLPIVILIYFAERVWATPLASFLALFLPAEATIGLSHLLRVVVAIALWATIFDSALACAQHLALRLVLFQAQAMPWNYARFLQTCCDRHLLLRVGGRYQFIHPLLSQRWMDSATNRVPE